MAKMLDLSVLKEQTYEIKLLDGQTLHLRKPSQRLLLEFVELDKSLKNLNVEEQFKEIQKIVLLVLNNNTEGKVFSELTDEYDLMIQQAIIKGYSEFISEVMNSKN